MPVQKITLSAEITEEMLGKRLDVALSQLFTQFSRGTLQTWIKQGAVTLNDQVLKKNSFKLTEVGNLHIDAELEEQTHWAPQAIDLDILFEDDSLIVINKPAGLVTHPAAGNPDNTLVNALLHHCPTLKDLPRAGIIHRLDKDTTGLLVVPKTLSAHNFLVDQLQRRLIDRHYQALVYGKIISGATVDAPIARHPTNRLKMAVVNGGKEAVTHYRVNTRFPDFTLLDLKLESGRTHQIRVHMNHIHHPLVGDQTYGRRLQIPKNTPEAVATALRQFKRQALHAAKLSLTHPESKETMTWEAPLPDDFTQLLQVMRDAY